MRSATQPKMTAAALLWKYNVQYQYIFTAIVLPLVETAGDLAARTYGSCHVAMMKLRTYKCNSLDCFHSNMCLIYYSCHGAMMTMVILRTYKCNSLHCFDSNVCLTYYSCHVAMMNMMILRTYKCNSLHCFDSNMYLTMYTM